MEPWGVSVEPGGYDTAEVDKSHGDPDRRRTTVMWLYVVRVPCDETGSKGINSYDLKK